MIQNAIVSDPGHIWINAASEGPLLLPARKALEEAVRWKCQPHLLHTKFFEVPLQLKRSLARLLNTSDKDIILNTSASSGVHLLANGFSWKAGDEVLLMEDDFPTNILPWLALEDRGVCIRQLRPKGPVLTVQEIREAVTEQTRWVCLSHIHTFTGYFLDIAAISVFLHEKNIHFAVNASQSIGNRPIDIQDWNADAVIGVGYKWLCGPYGTGFMWLKPEVRDQLTLNHAYWPAYLNGEELQRQGPIARKKLTSARSWDMFGTANYFNTVPLQAAIDFWLDQGLDAVQTHNDSLVSRFLDQLDRTRYDLFSPEKPDQRTHLIVLSRKNPAENANLHKALLQNGIHPAFWKGVLRFSPHAYNTPAEITKITQQLNSF